MAKWADILVLAVKPQFLEEVIMQIRDVTKPETLIISIAAGKSIQWIEEAFARSIRLVRCMPNTPALVGEGCTGVCVNARVTEEEKNNSIKLMESFEGEPDTGKPDRCGRSCFRQLAGLCFYVHRGHGGCRGGGGDAACAGL